MGQDRGVTARANSFGSVAADYDRLRPSPSQPAVAWLLEPATSAVGAGRRIDVVEVAAGTGLATRALVAAGHHVTALEPDERMRAILLGLNLPGVTVVAGYAEDLPLPDACADAVVIASAWHWVDPPRGVAEFARVLRPGGVFAAVWTGALDLDLLLSPSTALPEATPGLAQWAVEQRGQVAPAAAGPAPTEEFPSKHRSVDLPSASPFHDAAEAVFTFSRTMTADDLVALQGTYSEIITLPDDERARRLEQTRTSLAQRMGARGDDVLTVPCDSRCWRAVRD